ncbi:MAG: hypothetical protein V7607_6099 [Solirubrobacteraceae bacterium]
MGEKELLSSRIVENGWFIGYGPVVAAPFLHFVQTVRDAIVDAIRSRDAPRLHYVYGAQSVGKSALLRTLPDALSQAQGDFVVISVSAPTGAPDAAASAASRLTGELFNTRLILDPDREVLEAPEVPWADKLDLLRGVLSDPDHLRRLVVLVDEPRLWRTQLGGPFAEHTDQLASLLVSVISASRVVTTGRRPAEAEHRIVHHLEAGGDYGEWLDSAQAWGALAAAARDVSQRYEAAIARMTPLQLRFTVTLSHLERNDALGRIIRRPSPSAADLSEAVVAAVREQQPELTGLLARLSLVRVPFNDTLLKALHAPAPDTDAGRLLRSGLLFGTEGHYVLHDILRYALHQQRVRPADRDEVRAFHGELLEFYERKGRVAQERHDVTERLTCEVETFWHATLAGIEDADLRFPHRFPVQPLLYGTVMQRVHQRPEIAERVFEHQARVTKDAYAVHHLAFARDQRAADPDAVEAGYREALELDNSHPRWHARLIEFLIDQGATVEARAAWHDALAAQLDADDDAIAAELHRPVIARVLRIGEVEFAEAVFRELDDERVESDPALRALRVRLRALVEAERVGPVRPYRLLQQGWWMEPPRHLLRTMPGGRTLSHWWAARVTGVDNDGVTLQYAEVAPDAGEPTPGTTTVPRELYDVSLHDMALDELTRGHFLEVGFYRNGTPDIDEVVVQLVRAEPTLDDLPPSELPPQRYRQVAGLVQE